MSKKPTGRIILAASIGALIAAAFGFVFYGDLVDSFRAATRFTARWSFLWFVTAWSASALTTLWPGGWRSLLLYNRRGIGLGFAAAHIIHAGFFIFTIWGLGRPTNPVTLFGGGLGYVFVILMAVTSHDYWMRALTPKGWKLLHTIGATTIAFIFAFTYLGGLLRGAPIAAAALSLMGLAVVLKLAAWAKARRPQPA